MPRQKALMEMIFRIQSEKDQQPNSFKKRISSTSYVLVYIGLSEIISGDSQPLMG